MTIMRVFVAVLFPAGVAFAGDKYDCLDAYNGKNYTEALRLCRPLAEQGEFAAQNALGLMYLKGHGVSQNDFAAAKWFRKAAEQEDPWSHSAGRPRHIVRGWPRCPALRSRLYAVQATWGCESCAR